MRTKFVTKVQQGKVKTPVQRAFSLAEWDQKYKELQDGSEQDRNLWTAGRWIDIRLSALRAADEAVRFHAPHSRQKQFFVAALNRDASIVGRLEPPEVRPGHYSADAVVQGRVDHPQAGSMDPFGALEGAIDGARFVFREHPRPDADGVETAIDTIDNVRKVLNYAALYSYFLDIWNDLLWNGWRIDESGEIDIVEPSDIPTERRLACSQHREQSIIHEMAYNGVTHWKLVDDVSRQIEASARRVVAVSGSGNHRRFIVGPSKTPDVPRSSTLAIHELDTFMLALSREELPAMPGFTARQLLDAWQVLASLGDCLLHRFPADTGVFSLGKLQQFSATVAEADIVGVLTKCLDIPRDRALRIVDLFTFGENERQELWHRPLVKIEERYALLMAPLRAPNLVRSVEHWLQAGGVQLDKRGPAYEEFAQREIARAIRTSESIRDAKVHEGKATIAIGETSEEIDLLIRLGTTLLVGEVKCILYPASPHERRNYVDRMEAAAAQAQRKAALVRSNPMAAIEPLRLGGDGTCASVVPLVLTNQALFAGQVVNGTPVVDLRILGRYFREGYLEQDVTQGPEGKQVGTLTRFYKSEAEAAHNVEKYLNDPPQVAMRKAFLEEEFDPIQRLSTAPKPAVIRRVRVRLPVGSETLRVRI